MEHRQFGRRSIAAVLLVFIAAAPVASRAEPVTLKIATWNIAWLHRNNNSGQIRRSAADYARLKKYVDRLDADVVALQEVDGPEGAERIFDPAEYFFVFEQRADVQRAGFAFKRDLASRGVTVTPNADLASLELSGSLRRGVDVTLSTDSGALRLLAVHLKSGCHGNDLTTSTSDACTKLRQQVPIVVSWIDAWAAQGTPFVVLGDWNRRFEPPDTFWPEIDDATPPNADLSRVTHNQTSGCWGGTFPRYIDHIAFDLQSTAWIVPNSFSQQLFDASDTPHKAKLSDHCPISVAVAMPAGGEGPPGDDDQECCDEIDQLRERIERLEDHLGIGPP